MRQLILILTISLTANICYSQTNIWGIYLYKEGTYRQIDLRPDSTYYIFTQYSCGVTPDYHDTGIFIINADTIFLKSNDSTRNQIKFLYISHLPNNQNSSWYGETETLAEIFKCDTVLPNNLNGRLSDYEALFFGSHIKTQGYYNDGKLLFKINTFNKTKIITKYYSTGQIKSIEKYYKDKKTGDWYLFKDNGQIEKIETYKNDKLKGVMRNAL